MSGKRMKRWGAFVGAAALIVAIPAIAYASTTFVDVPAEHPHYDAVEWMASNNLTNGCSTVPSLYCPDDAVSRAEMAQFLYNYDDELGDHTPPVYVYWVEDSDSVGSDSDTVLEASCNGDDIAISAMASADDNGFRKPLGTYWDDPGTVSAAWSGSGSNNGAEVLLQVMCAGNIELDE